MTCDPVQSNSETFDIFHLEFDFAFKLTGDFPRGPWKISKDLSFAL